VDNRPVRWITASVLWMAGESSDGKRKPLVPRRREAVELHSPQEAGPSRRQLRDAGRAGRPGMAAGLGESGGPRGARQPSNRRAGLAKPSGAPPSHTWGGLALFRRPGQPLFRRPCPISEAASVRRRQVSGRSRREIRGSGGPGRRTRGNACSGFRAATPAGQLPGRPSSGPNERSTCSASRSRSHGSVPIIRISGSGLLYSATS
jgi:hypothetical protein